MPSCEEIEIALERRAHGDTLPAELTAPLDAHLPGCQRCQAYASALDLSRGGLAILAQAVARGVDWEAMERAIRARQRERRREVIYTALVGCVMIAVALVGLAAHAVQALHILAVSVPVILARVAWVFAETHRLAALQDRDELFAAERAHLARRLGALRVMRWAAIVVVLGVLAVAWQAESSAARLTYATLAILVGALWTRAWLVTIPRLSRLAAALEERP